MARSSSPRSRSVRAFLMLAAKSLAGTGESWSVSRGTKTGRRPLSDANDESGYVYVELAEALALFAEIKGLSFENAERELRDEGLLESALARPRTSPIMSRRISRLRPPYSSGGSQKTNRSWTGTSVSRWSSR